MHSAIQPVAPIEEGDRLLHMDVLRGFALLGILLVNFEYFTRPVQTIALGPDPSLTGLNHLADSLIGILAEGKFYALFSLLFGAGFALLYARAEQSGQPFWNYYFRRLAVLAAMGFAHLALVWSGDILLMYAFSALLMVLFFRHTPTTRLPKWALVWLLLPVFFYWLGIGGIELARLDPDAQAEVLQTFYEQESLFAAAAANAEHIYTSGSFSEVVRLRIDEWLVLMSWAPYWMVSILVFFLLGRWLVQTGRLTYPRKHGAFYSACRLWGLGLGLPLSIVGFWLISDENPLLPSPALGWAVTLTSAGSALLALGYFGLVVKHAQRLHWLAPAGRMALTNYLLQSLCWTTLFYGYGFGLWGKLPQAVQLPLAVVFFAVQVAFSHWWLARFRFGPAEWLWRSLTYWRLQPMRS